MNSVNIKVQSCPKVYVELLFKCHVKLRNEDFWHSLKYFCHTAVIINSFVVSLWISAILVNAVHHEE